VEANSGAVASGFQIYWSFGSTQDITTPTGHADLSYGAASSASIASAINDFDSLAYHADSIGSTTLRPSVDPTALQYWKETTPGTSTAPAGYRVFYFSSSDTINPLPALIINVEPTNVPEPTSAGLLATDAAAILARRRNRKDAIEHQSGDPGDLAISSGLNTA
jgi:hypothetical protein